MGLRGAKKGSNSFTDLYHTTSLFILKTVERTPSENHHSRLKLMLIISSPLNSSGTFPESKPITLRRSLAFIPIVYYYKVCDCMYE